MRLLDSRRLPGPNLLWDKPGAVIDVEFGDLPASLVIGAWESEAWTWTWRAASTCGIWRISSGTA